MPGRRARGCAVRRDGREMTARSRCMRRRTARPAAAPAFPDARGRVPAASGHRLGEIVVADAAIIRGDVEVDPLRGIARADDGDHVEGLVTLLRELLLLDGVARIVGPDPIADEPATL